LPFNDSEFDMVRFRAGYGTDHDPEDTLGRLYLLAILAFDKLLWLDPASETGRWAIGVARNTLTSFGEGR
jgi:hypothetical protein